MECLDNHKLFLKNVFAKYIWSLLSPFPKDFKNHSLFLLGLGVLVLCNDLDDVCTPSLLLLLLIVSLMEALH